MGRNTLKEVRNRFTEPLTVWLPLGEIMSVVSQLEANGGKHNKYYIIKQKHNKYAVFTEGTFTKRRKPNTSASLDENIQQYINL